MILLDRWEGGGDAQGHGVDHMMVDGMGRVHDRNSFHALDAGGFAHARQIGSSIEFSHRLHVIVRRRMIRRVFELCVNRMFIGKGPMEVFM